MTFFKPSARYIDWLVNYANGRFIWDVGCGDGALLHALHDRRIKAIGIDCYPYDRIPYGVIPAKAEKCAALRSAKNQLVVICRPCHDGFPARVARVLDPSTEMLYVGFYKNRSVDLSGLVLSKTTAPKGPEGECTYQVTRRS